MGKRQKRQIIQILARHINVAHRIIGTKMMCMMTFLGVTEHKEYTLLVWYCP